MTDGFDQLFYDIDQQVINLKTDDDLPYLEALAHVLETFDVPTVYSEMTIKKSVQLAVLKGMREFTQPNHQMTPETLGLLMGYMIEQLMKNKEQFSMLDIVTGTGNLLYTILQYVKKDIEAYGVEVDDLLIRIAASTANLIAQPVQLFKQDALEPLLIDPVDVVIADLPIGYYPNEETAKTYELKAQEGMSFAHHLLIEQAIRHTKEGGYLFFLVPDQLFLSEQAAALQNFLKKEAWFLAVLQLPDNLFASTGQNKSLIVLQKLTDQLNKPADVLLAKVPKMSNKEAMSLFFEKIRIWNEESMSERMK